VVLSSEEKGSLQFVRPCQVDPHIVVLVFSSGARLKIIKGVRQKKNIKDV
jgi:hypothetical protein